MNTPHLSSTVFIVDDDEAVRDSLRWLLEANGYRVRAYASGESFLEDYDPSQIGVLIADVRMPDMGGIEVLGEVLSRHPREKFVMLTTSDVEEDVFRAIEDGALGYVMKESPIETIRAAVQSAMDGEVFMTEDVRRIYETRKGAKGLSAREAEALVLAAKGAGNREIAAAMYLSENSVKMFLKRAFYKLGAANRAEAVQLAVRRGLIPATT